MDNLLEVQDLMKRRLDTYNMVADLFNEVGIDTIEMSNFPKNGKYTRMIDGTLSDGSDCTCGRVGCKHMGVAVANEFDSYREKIMFMLREGSMAYSDRVVDVLNLLEAVASVIATLTPEECVYFAAFERCEVQQQAAEIMQLLRSVGRDREVLSYPDN